jgi:predicted AAA+ superfamily ATPase
MNKVIKLPFINKLESHIKSGLGFIQVLIGPRQVGKTTSVLNYLETHHADHFIYESADLIFNASPQWLIELWQKAQSEQKLLVIDEIQKCENWAETIKILFDKTKRNKQKLNCVLLGSSSLQIQKGLTESLTGRFQLINAYHWNGFESLDGYDLSFEEYLKFGGYPASYQIQNPQERMSYIRNSIINTVIEKDLLQYNKVKSPALFKQAFEILISYPAQEISYTKILGQIQESGNVELVKYYIQLFEGAFLIKALEKYSSKTVKTKASSPKILPLAPCLYYSTVLAEYDADEKGRVFELVVGAQLFKTEMPLYYWREGKFEVDYILKHGKKIWAIEVKSGRKKSTQGLIEFQKQFPQAVCVIVTPQNYAQFEADPLKFLEGVSG